MKNRVYILALFLVGSLFVVIYLLISSYSQGDSGTKTLANYSPYPPADATEQGTETDSGQGWGDWLVRPTAGAENVPAPTYTQTPAPVTTPAPTATATAAPASNVLRNGDEGDDVVYVQRRLKELGYLSGSADGVFGNATEKALKEFQAANGLSADGVVGDKTMAKLKSSSAKSKAKDTAKATSVPQPKSYTPSEPTTYRYLQVGSSGSDVTKLQNRLRELGYLDKKATGKYDEDTMYAVRAFQERNGEWVDGVAGQDTQTTLYSDKALAASSRD